MLIKICGIRSLHDALAAIHAGADMLGFNFHPPSPRYIQPEACADLVAALQATHRPLPVLVGVFVNSSQERMNDILVRCHLDLLQMHGDEAPEALAAFDGRAFKALRAASLEAARASLAAYRPATSGARRPDILLDASVPGMFGGSGQTANWGVAARLAAESRVMLAGGLHPGNVAQAVAAVRPWGVDVASGVERAPGVKDAHKMQLFVQAAREAAARYPWGVRN